MYASKANHKAINSLHEPSVIYEVGEVESLAICLVKKDFVLPFKPHPLTPL
jgi:hypothetical protein